TVPDSARRRPPCPPIGTGSAAPSALNSRPAEQAWAAAGRIGSGASPDGMRPGGEAESMDRLREFLSQWFDEDGVTIAQFVIAAVAVVLLILLLTLLLRWLGRGRRTGRRQPRLAIVDVAVVDNR